MKILKEMIFNRMIFNRMALNKMILKKKDSTNHMRANSRFRNSYSYSECVRRRINTSGNFGTMFYFLWLQEAACFF